MVRPILPRHDNSISVRLRYPSEDRPLRTVIGNRFFMDGDYNSSVILDRGTGAILTVDGPMVFRLPYIRTFIRSCDENSVEIDGLGIGLAMAALLDDIGVDVNISYSWTR